MWIRGVGRKVRVLIAAVLPAVLWTQSVGAQFPEAASKSEQKHAGQRQFAGYELPRFTLQPTDIQLSRRCRPAQYFDAIGNRSYVCGKEDGPYEMWVWPLQILVDGRLSFRPHEALDFFELTRYAHTIECDADRTRIRYLQAQIAADATFIAPDDEQAILIQLAVDVDQPGTLAFSFIPKLMPQWPAAVGGVAAQWNAGLGAFVISEPSGKLAAVVGSPHAVRGTAGIQYLLPDAPLRFEMDLEPARCRRGFIPIIVTAVEHADAPKRAISNYQRVLKNFRSIVEKHHDNWQQRLADLTRIHTPDAQLDQAFLRNAVSLQQSLVRSASLGDGLVAGYGPAGPTSQRPGFAWFFTGDVSLNAPAYLGAGLSDTLAVGLRFAKQHQRADGKIPHEVVLSAHLCNWFEDYPFAYIHGDTTALWIHACRLYVDATGKRSFLEAMWPAMIKGYNWLRAQDADGDSLPDNTLAGMGASEIGALLYDLQTDVHLASTAAAAFQDMADLAARLNDGQLAEQAADLADRARQRLGEAFWNPRQNCIAHCLRTDGTVSSEITAWAAMPILLGMVTDEQANSTLDYLDSAAITTPWGCRMLSSASEYFDPLGYNQGAVWPFITGLVACADFQRGRADAGYAKIKTSAELTFAEALGRTPEVLSGSRPRSLDASVPNQMFSAMTTVGPVARGLFGLHPRALDNLLQLRPCLPSAWTAAEINHVHFGNTRLNIKIHRRANTYDVVCTYDPRGTKPQIDLKPANGTAGTVTCQPFDE